MKHRTEIEIAGRWLDLHARDQTVLAEGGLRVPARDYVDEEIFRLEQRGLFRDRPVVACLSADIPRPGDHVVTESGGVPLLILRNREGEPRAFVNTCRHRGAPLARECGNFGASIVCPFHGWTYDLDGHLRGQPRSMQGFAEIEPATLSLRPLPAAEGHGLVVVRPGGGAPIDLPAFLGGLEDDLDSYGLEDYVVFDRLATEWHCNWKLLVDTFLESYHVLSLHGRSVGPDYPGHVMVYDDFGDNLRIPVPRASLLELADTPPKERSLLPHATVQYFLPPGAVVNHTMDHFILWRLVPLAADRTRAEMSMYTPEAVADEAAERSMRAWFDLHDGVTRDEDYPESERIHAILTSGAVEATRLGRNEAALVHFHRWRRDALAALEPAGPGADSIRSTFERYALLVSEGDADGIAALYSEGATLEDPAGSAPVVGRNAIREFYAAALARRGRPRVSLTGPVRIAGARGAAPLRSLATRDGQSISIEIIDVMTFDSDGQILSMCAYWSEENIEPA